MDHSFDSLVFRACFLSSGKEGLSMNFFMELLSSLTIRDILAVAQLLTTSLDYILKIIELKKSAAFRRKDNRHLSIHRFPSMKRKRTMGIAFSSVPTPIVYSILELFQGFFSICFLPRLFSNCPLIRYAVLLSLIAPLRHFSCSFSIKPVLYRSDK